MISRVETITMIFQQYITPKEYGVICCPQNLLLKIMYEYF
jgi:hypothetical protein